MRLIRLSLRVAPVLFWGFGAGCVAAQGAAPGGDAAADPGTPVQTQEPAAQADMPALPQRFSGQQASGITAQAQGPVAILVLDFDQAYLRSAWGRNSQQEAEAVAREIYAENTRLEEDLIAGEQALKEERDSLTPAEFRRRAEAFDARAQTIRRERAEVLRDFEARNQADRNAFVQATLPAAAAIMQERGAAVVLDRQQALIAANAVDITDELVIRLDASLGEGPGFPDSVPEPQSGAASGAATEVVTRPDEASSADAPAGENGDGSEAASEEHGSEEAEPGQ
ncbi:OmpH family outer membrane protein [Paracoccus aerodenitrificans]|uniref:OmpH family outer membrane protein n=1 Tax=Paracoccus aerodenitrificans TaxID=3017781 RepID=UPI0022F02C7C|nr:OmpH family outer membrane protein [Paracoccus aerodenitrificans]WBU62659.1 OmpH family outer membrane protein [Paracoccus aerodenitrificans]